jgi:hypothetical protein
MFAGRWTREALETYHRLKSEAEASLAARQASDKAKATKAEGLFKQVRKCLEHLLNDPRHPGLKTHKYELLVHPYNPGESVFEAYAQNQTPGAYRLFWCYGPGKGEITIIAITPHP